TRSKRDWSSDVCSSDLSAVPLLVKSNDGRPTKIEGNPQHPDSNGSTDAFTQASILNLYDPDRAARFTQNGTNATREAALDFLSRSEERRVGKECRCG